jgi:hypothetical protein
MSEIWLLEEPSTDVVATGGNCHVFLLDCKGRSIYYLPSKQSAFVFLLSTYKTSSSSVFPPAVTLQICAFLLQMQFVYVQGLIYEASNSPQEFLRPLIQGNGNLKDGNFFLA